jgi:hypothetical protein
MGPFVSISCASCQAVALFFLMRPCPPAHAACLMHLCCASQRQYYYNSITGESVWTKPPAVVVAQAGAVILAQRVLQAARDTKGDAGHALHPNWASWIPLSSGPAVHVACAEFCAAQGFARSERVPRMPCEKRSRRWAG